MEKKADLDNFTKLYFNAEGVKQEELFTNQHLDAMEKKIEYEQMLSQLPAKEEYKLRNKLDMSKDSRWNSSSSSYIKSESMKVLAQMVTKQESGPQK